MNVSSSSLFCPSPLFEFLNFRIFDLLPADVSLGGASRQLMTEQDEGVPLPFAFCATTPEHLVFATLPAQRMTITWTVIANELFVDVFTGILRR